MYAKCQHSNEHLHIFKFKCRMGARNLFTADESTCKNERLSGEKHFSAFCFHPTTVMCFQRFYEVSEDKKPECGMEMVLGPLEDWLRVSTHANTPPVTLLLSLKSVVAVVITNDDVPKSLLQLRREFQRLPWDWVLYSAKYTC